MIKYKLIEVKSRIFLATFEDNYDMAMTLFRYQETYESPNPNFRGKQFYLLDFVEWYSKEKGDGIFTYPKDWSGYNFPSSIFNTVCNASSTDLLKRPWILLIPDYNKYDRVMEEIYRKCREMLPDPNDDKFYLIGSMENSDSTIAHEVAHGFFYSVPEYKKEMLNLTDRIEPDQIEYFHKILSDLGYTEEVFSDEMQAFLSTGWEWFPESTVDDKPFIEVYKKYNELIK